jgi:hypothetical protein
MMYPRIHWLWAPGLLALATVTLLAGCGTLPRNPVPSDLAQRAAVPGMPGVRGWGGSLSEAFEEDLARSFAQESPETFPAAADGFVHYAHLALSGGGANGAFGAGFLSGWTKAGTRPTFKIVTGVSTGALMAPFAFLGPEHDPALREFYTTTSSRDVFIATGLLQLARRALFSDSVADSAPLAALIARHVDDDLLRRVGEAHAQGRRLYIGTVDLDALRFVVWNMGLIASSASPHALTLFRQVMLASASIPIAFPPVIFDVTVAGESYDELHVDGAVAANVFFNQGLYRAATIRRRGGHSPPEGREDIFVIHNGQLFTAPQPTRRTVPRIALRVLDAAARSGTIGDLFRIQAVALVSGASFQWVTIPEDIVIAGEETFDPVQMRALFDAGSAAAQAPHVWRTAPPGFVGE